MIATPTEITYFLEIYQTKHISKSAMRLGITQPTLTQALKRLEEKIGAPLFHRTKQGVIPTESAFHLFSRAKNLQECWSEIQNGFTSLDTELKGNFTLGCHASVAAYTLPTLFKNLEDAAPQIKIHLVHDVSRKITEKIVSYEIDLGFVVNPPRHPDLVLKKLGQDKVTFWKKKGSLKNHTKLFADINLMQVKELLDKTSKKYFTNWDLIPTTSLELIRTLTSQGLGVGILPERVAKADQNNLEIFNKDLPFHQDEIYLVYRKEVMSSKAGTELIRLSGLKFP